MTGDIVTVTDVEISETETLTADEVIGMIATPANECFPARGKFDIEQLRRALVEYRLRWQDETANIATITDEAGTEFLALYPDGSSEAIVVVGRERVAVGDYR